MEGLSFSTVRQCLLAQCTSWATNQRVYKISFLIEKPQNTFCAIMSHQDIYKSLQKPWRDTSPSEERAYACISGQAMPVLVGKEVSSSWTPGHPPHLSAPLGFTSAAWWILAPPPQGAASGRSPSLIAFPASQQILGISQNLVNFAHWYHVGI